MPTLYVGLRNASGLVRSAATDSAPPPDVYTTRSTFVSKATFNGAGEVWFFAKLTSSGSYPSEYPRWLNGNLTFYDGAGSTVLAVVPVSVKIEGAETEWGHVVIPSVVGTGADPSIQFQASDWEYAEEPPCEVGGAWEEDPTSVKATVWDKDGSAYQETFNSFGMINLFDPLPEGPRRIAFRSTGRKVIPAGSYADFYLFKIGFPPGAGIETIRVAALGNQTYSQYVDLQPEQLSDVVSISAALTLAAGVGEAPCLDDLIEGEEGYEPETWPEDETVPPFPPAESETTEPPTGPDKPSKTDTTTTDKGDDETPPAEGCECEIYIADQLDVGLTFVGDRIGNLVSSVDGFASYLGDCLEVLCQAFYDGLEWYFENWEQNTQRRHQEVFDQFAQKEENDQTRHEEMIALGERACEAFEGIEDVLGEIRDRLPIEVTYEMGLPGRVQVQDNLEEVDDFMDGGI